MQRRKQLNHAVKQSLRDLGSELSLLNHRVGSQIGISDVDLECLDLISREGPLGPGALARLAGLHPATLTGVLARLERGGWVVRERDPEDRRAVVLRVAHERTPELSRAYRGMNVSMDRLLADYTDEELELLAEFLRRTAAAGRSAGEELAER